MISRQSVLILLVLALVCSLTVLSVTSGSLSNRSSFMTDLPGSKEIPILYSVPDFSLTDSTGERFSREDMTGKVWVVDFIFTTCAGICPVMTTHMADLQKAFMDDPLVHFLSISVNPEVDTPEVLTDYGERYGADFSRWHFVTGEREEIHRLAVEGFKLGSVEEPILHSDKFALVDEKGFIRGYYSGTELEDCVQLARDIGTLFP